MDQRYLLVGILTLITCVLLYTHMIAEGFSTKQDKASAIFAWFNNNPNPTYNAYKRDLKSASNIVEYEDVLGLFQDRNLTLESVSKVL